ncbi:uncharacterized protein TNCV_2823061 [Trichonephila clavipes]|nr:uncharacterized protein TNCV_2823061 [Trichonephila clavipes]
MLWGGKLLVETILRQTRTPLIRALTEEWDKLPQQMLDNVVQSMIRPKRPLTLKKPNTRREEGKGPPSKVRSSQDVIWGGLLSVALGAKRKRLIPPQKYARPPPFVELSRPSRGTRFTHSLRNASLQCCDLLTLFTWSKVYFKIDLLRFRSLCVGMTAFTRRIKRLDINGNRLFTKLKIRKYINTSFELTFKPPSKDSYTRAFGDGPRNFETMVKRRRRHLRWHPSLLTTTPQQRKDASALDRFNVHRYPTRRVFGGTGIKLVTKQARIRYLYHSATAAPVNFEQSS